MCACLEHTRRGGAIFGGFVSSCMVAGIYHPVNCASPDRDFYRYIHVLDASYRLLHVAQSTTTVSAPLSRALPRQPSYTARLHTAQPPDVSHLGYECDCL
jgi:hypothetical protein